ncbi:MAG: acyltransferase [Actinomycetota bacterium]|nr:acyltransferase [Actinomycetota bacterium]
MTASPSPDAAIKAPSHTRRVDWLDGVRGAAAMFVVLHHIWLATWPKFPRNVGPWWVGWMLYGHLAVAVFIVVSGFSLTLAPMSRGASLSGGARRFLRRRAWRILPPYWAALIFSAILTWTLVQPGLGIAAITKGFLVHGLLLQDVVGSAAPNGAFWSIAVEWQIYFAFPLILWLARRTNFGTSVLCTVAVVLIARELTQLGSPLNKINHLTPQFLALFAMGVLAVHLGGDRRAMKLRRPLTAAGLIAVGAFVAVAVIEGSVWVVDRYFWIDLLFGAGIACLMALMHGGGAARARHVLASPVALRLGLFSYSIYLLHGPLVGLIDVGVLARFHLPPLAKFGLLLVIGIPVILVVCYGFHLMFEAPFLHRRDRGALLAIPGVGLLRGRRQLARPASGGTEVAAAREAT